MIGSPIEEIKNKLDIAQVVAEYVKLQKAGANWRALCPFHQEKGPSFFVTPARQMWHCFGCGVGGSVFDFIMQIEGVEFGDALRLLAQKAGVELPQRDPIYLKAQSERKRLYELTELACRFFEKQLASTKSGEEATAYLKKRGVNEESFQKWRIGYAPDSLRSLLDFLLSRGFREYEVGRAGLLVRSEQGILDRFRSRIVFPVFDLQSQVVGFGGRTFGKEQRDLAKYINTPSTPLYDKSRLLYGLDKAKLAIRRQDSCVMVEGYMDVILVSQAGTENVVATSGTALTSSHLSLLKRYSENLTLAFDMDVAGDSATKRSIDLALEQGFQLNVVQMPEGKDPADVAAEGKEAWENVFSKASSIFDYFFTSAFKLADTTTARGKREAASILLPVIKKIPNAIEQTHWIQRLADELDLKEEVVREELRKVGEEPSSLRKGGVLPQAQSPPPQKSRRELLEEHILVLLFQNPKHMAELKERTKEEFSPETREILVGLEGIQGTLELASLKDAFPASTSERLQYLAMQAELLDSLRDQEEQETQEEFQLCLKALSLLSLKEKLDAVAKEIKKAEQENNQEKLQALLQEFHSLSRELSSP